MTALFITLGILAVLIALVIFLIFPAIRRHPDRELLSGLYIAHRGLHGIEGSGPENSLSAFRFAAENGFAIEIDIHIIADGEVVVFHDDTLKRVCGVDGRVEDKTLKELKELRLCGTDEQIPTLKECLETVNGRVPLLIEFKSLGGCAPLCRAANEILKDYNGKYIIQSFYPPVLSWYRKNRPDVCRGQLSQIHGKENPWYYNLASCQLTNVIARPDFLSFKVENKNFFFFKAVRKLGAFPVGWTFRSQEKINEVKGDINTFIFERFLPDRGNGDA